MMTTSSQPSSPALSRRSRSDVFRANSPRSIFRYSHSGILFEFQTESRGLRQNNKSSPIDELILVLHLTEASRRLTLQCRDGTRLQFASAGCSDPVKDGGVYQARIADVAVPSKIARSWALMCVSGRRVWSDTQGAVHRLAYRYSSLSGSEMSVTRARLTGDAVKNASASTQRKTQLAS